MSEILREYVRQILLEAPQRFYHGSKNSLKVGSIIGGKKSKNQGVWEYLCSSAKIIKPVKSDW